MISHKSILALSITTIFFSCAKQSTVEYQPLNDLKNWYQVVADTELSSIVTDDNPSCIMEVLILNPTKTRTCEDFTTEDLQEPIVCNKLSLAEARILEEEIRSGCWVVEKAPVISILVGQTSTYEITKTIIPVDSQYALQNNTLFKVDYSTKLLKDNTFYLSDIQVIRENGMISQNQIIELDETNKAGIYKIHFPKYTDTDTKEKNHQSLDEMIYLLKIEAVTEGN